MEGVRRGGPGGAYVREPRRSRVDMEEEMAAVEIQGGHCREPQLSSPPAFMVARAENATVLECLNDLRPPSNMTARSTSKPECRTRKSNHIMLKT